MLMPALSYDATFFRCVEIQDQILVPFIIHEPVLEFFKRKLPLESQAILMSVMSSPWRSQIME